MADVCLSMEGIVKEFSGVKALNNVNLTVERGEIHAICGENGAGKSTLMNVLSGLYPYGSYSGKVIYDGEECRFQGIRDSERKGIVIIHQELALVPYMTVAENMFLGNEQGTKFRLDWDRTYEEANRLLKVTGLRASPRSLVKDISVGQQQLVEIAKALAKNVRLLILDEPTASLNEDDSQKLLRLLLQFKREGLTSILISHKLNELEQVADRITVIRDGATIETLAKSSGDISESRIIKGMVGREMSDRYPRRESHIGDVNLEVRDWTVFHPLYEGRKVCDRVNLKLRRGEVVGVSGLMGAGRTEMGMSIFGKSYGAHITGELYVNGKRVALKNASAAIAHGIAYVTEDRKSNGLILSSSIRVNTTLANLKKVRRGLAIDRDFETAVANEYCRKLRVKCTGPEQPAGALSGGNQQKVLLSKWMFAEPDVLILDEPTRGVDVGAKYEIYSIINDLVAQNKSVLLISSEMPEVLGMCDRIYVMNEGRLIAEFSRADASQEAIMTRILQSAEGAGQPRAG